MTITLEAPEKPQEAPQRRLKHSRALTLTPVSVPTLESPTKPRWPGDSVFEPETQRQAQTHETYKNRYVAIGLCHHCAGQAAYGHQHGFSVVEQPRHLECLQVVDLLPNTEVNAWRSMDVANANAASQHRLEISVRS